MSFRQDVQYASRTLRKSALLSVAVIATLTIGIGLDTGVFSMINAIAFRARVDKDPGSFLRVMTAYTKDLAQAGRWGSSTLDDYLAFRGARSVRDLAGVSLVFASLEQDDPRDVRALLVTCNFFSLYALERPKLGRLLQPGDCSNSRPVMVMGEELWRERYAADPNIVGKAVHYNEQPLTVIGVAPASFAGRLSSAGGWLPYTIQPYLKLGPSLLQASETPWLQIMGRLSAGFSRQDAASELALLASQQDRSHAGRKTALLVTDGSMFQEPGMRERAVWTIPLIMGVLSLALLLACANVATLLLSRAVARHREIAVRLALGAGNARLLRMLFTENLLLACVAGAASIYLAYRVPPFLNHFFFRRPVAIPMDPDWRVFAYLSAVTLLTAALSGAAPAFQALRVQLSESLKGHQRLFGGPRSGAGLRNLLVAAQVALSLVLLTGAGIFIRGYQQTATADPGVETRQVLAMSLRLHGTKPGSWASFHRTLAEHLETVPGVKSVAYAARPPLHPDSILVQLPGQPAVGVQLNTVSPGYFATLGIPILHGRAIDVSDSGALHTVSRVVVSEGFAKEFWPRENALGKTFRTPAGGVL
ncbi:MAG TPA: ABC transporter permease, partial [Bryobacteraceae bacterium]|nr:ABC transporter permease [Bryobacteraceae bacterium]